VEVSVPTKAAEAPAGFEEELPLVTDPEVVALDPVGMVYVICVDGALSRPVVS
jgi:hypothetical protein